MKHIIENKENFKGLEGNLANIHQFSQKGEDNNPKSILKEISPIKPMETQALISQN